MTTANARAPVLELSDDELIELLRKEEELRAATEQMNALGIKGRVVHATNDAAAMRAYVESLPACETTD
jgi:hypothetical protein